MSEDLPTQYPDNQQPSHDTSPRPQTYDEVLAQHPDMHPDLRSHVERLAATATADQVSSFNQDESSLPAPKIESDRGPAYIEIVARANAATMDDIKASLRKKLQDVHDLPLDDESLFRAPREIHNVESTFMDEPHSNEEFIEVIGLMSAVDKAMRDRYKQHGPDVAANARNKVGLEHIGFIPQQQLREIYRSPEGEPLRELLARSEAVIDIQSSLSMLRHIHNFPGTNLDFLDKNGNYRYDKTIAALAAKEKLPNALIFSQEYHELGESENATPEENSKQIRLWQRRFLDTLTDLPEADVDEKIFASYSRTSKDGLADKKTLEGMLLETASVARELGPENCKTLREKAGIIDLDYASAEQHKLMLGLLKGDKKVIEHLMAGDVTVIFADSKGDYNGAMGNAAQNYATASNRTLLFHVHKPSDFASHLNVLKDAGVRPSTVVLANHGEVGGSGFGDENGFKLTNDDLRHKPKSVDNVYSYKNMEHISKTVDEYMQDSRGIDDNQEAKGRRRIIMNSCLQGREADVERYHVEPSKLRRFIRKLLGNSIENVEYAQESPAATLAKQANHPYLDIYASPRTIVTNRTPKGVEHFARPEGSENDETAALDRVPALRFFMNAQGKLIVEQVDRIQLRKEASYV